MFSKSFFPRIVIHRIVSYQCYLLTHIDKPRAIVEGLCSPNWSLFRKVKTVGKWLVTLKKGGVKQETCVWSHLPNFICQCYRGILFRKCYNQNDSTFIRSVLEFVIKPSFSITQFYLKIKPPFIIFNCLHFLENLSLSILSVFHHVFQYPSFCILYAFHLILIFANQGY